MHPRKPIRIVGGGLAGLTLGIGLRQRDVPVVIHEAGAYPRHRVCGEFISGRGQTALTRLGLDELLLLAGAVRAQTAAFFTATQSTPARALPAAALCISRFTLDELLAKQFCALGGELLPGRRVAGDFGEGWVRATGRRLRTAAKGAGGFGLKIHARHLPLAADLEMHFTSAGYVGMCKINGGKVNVCALFYQPSSARRETKNWRELLRGQPGSPLHDRLANAEFDEASFCAVAGLSLQPQVAAGRTEISLGDAITMIPPVTGNGMSMAFESAELAMTPLTAWSDGLLSWNETRQQIARDCDARFGRRLQWAKWLQRIILAPMLQNQLVALAARSASFSRLAFQLTR